MPFYSTVEKVADVLPRGVYSSTTVTSAVVANVLTEVDALINGALSESYTVPVSNSPLLEVVATDMAAYRLLRRQFTANRKNDSDWPDKFKSAEKILEKIAAGKMSLVDSAGTLITRGDDTVGVWSNNEHYNPTFDEGPASDWFQDHNKLDDLSRGKDGSRG